MRFTKKEKIDIVKGAIEVLKIKWEEVKNWFKEHELKTLVKKENTYFIKGDRYSFIYKILI